MAGKVKWDGDAFKAKIEKQMRRRLETCANIGLKDAVRSLNIDGTGKVTEKVKGRKQTRLVYGANPSKPGEPPHKQYGTLIESVAYEVLSRVARIGTSLKYGRYLELGTSRMAARPWLRPMLSRNIDKFRAILTKPMGKVR